MDEKNKEKEQELAKQLSTYADSFTAFSFVQGAARPSAFYWYKT